MTNYNSRLLTPLEDEEIYPYRQVWRSLLYETGILLIVTVLFFVLFDLVKLQLPNAIIRPISFVLVFLPLGLWLLFSWLQERFVPQPRIRLIAIVIISGLVANAIGIPFIENVLQVDRWLPQSSAINRIIGYTFTVGIVNEFLKYVVLRFSAWDDCFRVRVDGIAYALASAVGYATIANLQYVASTEATLDLVAIRVFNTIIIHYASSIVIGYGLAETRIGHPTPLLLMITLAISATITGFAVPVRASLANASFRVIEVNASTPIQGIAVSLVLLAAAVGAIIFLIGNSERQDREIAAGREK